MENESFMIPMNFSSNTPTIIINFVGPTITEDPSVGLTLSWG